MRAKSIKGKSFEEIQSALNQSMSDGFRPTLAIVFLSVRQDRRAISAIPGIAPEEHRITIKGRATRGRKAVGTEKTVTKSIGNHVYNVDDIPVLDITGKFSGTTCCVALKQN